MLASHQRRRTRHDLTSGWDRAGAQPWVVGGRATISRPAKITRGGHAHRLLRRLRDGLFRPARGLFCPPAGRWWRGVPAPPCRVAPLRGPPTAGLRGRLALLAARADGP